MADGGVRNLNSGLILIGIGPGDISLM